MSSDALLEDDLETGGGPDALMADVDAHGVAHVHLAGVPRPLVVRNGQVFWNCPDDQHFSLDVRGTVHRFRYDRLLFWTLPTDIWR